MYLASTYYQSHFLTAPNGFYKIFTVIILNRATLFCSRMFLLKYIFTEYKAFHVLCLHAIGKTCQSLECHGG